jgi:protein-disulfide isomerase
MTFRSAPALGIVLGFFMTIRAAAQVEPCAVFAPEPPPCATPASPPAGAVAIVDGGYILLADLDPKVRELVEGLEAAKAEARRKAVRREGEALLVEREAARRRVAAKELRYAEVDARVVAPADAEVAAEIAAHANKYPKDSPEWAGTLARIALVNGRTEKLDDELVARLAKETPLTIGADPNAPGLAPDAALVTVGDRKLTLAELGVVLDTAAIRASMGPFRRERTAVESAIHDRLAKGEAARRGITVEQLTKLEVDGKAGPGADAKKRREAEDAFDRKLREGHAVRVLVEQPRLPRQTIAVAGSPARGNPAAPVTLVEFGDFECPPCGKLWNIVEEALKGREESVRYVFRQNPLAMHPFAAKAAEAALAAHAQGKFFAYANLLFTNQKALDVASLKRWASEAGLDRARFENDLDSGRFAADVKQELREGERYGVLGTPALFVNGELLSTDAYSVEGLRAAFDRAAAAAKPPAGAVAMVDGEPVLLAELDPKVREAVEGLETRRAEARRKAVKREVEALLVEHEAAKRKVPAKDVFCAEIDARLTPPTDADIDAEIAAHAGRYPKDAERARAWAKGNLVDERTAKVHDELVARLAKETPVTMGADPNTAGLAPGAVLATVGERKLTLADLRVVLDTAAVRASLFPWYQESGAVDGAIGDRLAKKEAARRGITVEQLTKLEVADKVKPATDEEIAAAAKELAYWFGPDPAKARRRAVEYLAQRRQGEAQEAFDRKLREGHEVALLIPEPKVPRQTIAIAGRPARGSASAPVTLVEFADFQCPSCGYMSGVVEEALKGREKSVRFVFRQFPLVFHPFAPKAAEAGLAANAQGKFFAFARLLYAHQDALDVASLKRWASAAGLDRGRFDRDLDSARFAADVAQDLRDGERHAVFGTPSFYLDGEPLDAPAYTVEGMRAALDKAIAAKK